MKTEETKAGHCPKCSKLLTGRHCLSCGFSYPLAHTVKAHSKPEPNEGQAIIDRLKAFCLVLPANAIEWRVKDETGFLSSLQCQVKALMTDGIVGYFQMPDERVIFAHWSNFVADKKEGGGYAGPRKSKAKPDKGPSKAKLRAIALADED